MLGPKEYVVSLADHARMRHYHETRRGRVVAFAIQLEVQVRDEWVPVVRYDTAHGRPHIDLYLAPTRKLKRPLHLSPADAMTLADEDIKENWERYSEEFLRRNKA